MSMRSVPWQRTVSDAVSWHQDQAQSATIYILREVGPTGFLLKEEGESKKFKVFLGDPHKCTCSVFMKEKDLCKHICWVLLKKFRLDRHNELSFQRGLVEREINEVLRGLAKREDPRRRAAANRIARNASKGENSYSHSDGRQALEQREITEEDVCPICQDELLGGREPVTFCRFGCAKSIHIKCMKVWADHQKSTGETVLKCPLCREDFGQIDTVEAEYRNSSLQKTRAERADIHMGVTCDTCNQSPISGKCYKCSECIECYLCQNCFASNLHSQHSFKFRQRSNQRWRPAQRGSGGALPSAVISDLENRDITEDDYDTLLQLDNPASNQASSVPEHVVKSFHVETVRDGSNLLSLGTQCRVCLRAYAVGQLVKRLPCKHKFHAACIDQWLLHEHPTCPVDGTVVWNPFSTQTRQTKKKMKAKQEDKDGTETQNSNLSIVPGIGVVKLFGRDPAAGRLRNMIGSGAMGGDRNQTDIGLTADFQLTGASLSSKPTITQRSTPDRQRRPLQSSDPVNTHPRLHDSINSPSTSNYHAASERTLHIGNELSNQKPPTGRNISHRSSVKPITLEHHGSHIASIPLPREEAMTPIGSKSSPGSRLSGESEVGASHGVIREIGQLSRNSPGSRLLGENEVGTSHGGVRERGRLTRKGADGIGRRVRSCSNGRNRSSSRDRLQRNSDNKPQSAESLFLGSANGQLAGASKKTSSHSHHPRSKVKPLKHPTSSDGDSLDLALAGNALDSLHLNLND